ncbi:MAG: hypothetical protein HOV94_20710 [Saccharothrix sp.]|nr:hypothetical protein [Saccharothrix sp.]
MRLPLLAVVLGLVVAGCVSAYTGPGPVEPDQRVVGPDPADFPVTAVPRPIVLLGSPLLTVETPGSEQEKIALEVGRFAFRGAEPPAPGPTSVALADGPATLPLIGVRDAVTAMSAQGREGEPVELVSAELGPTEFQTDRGLLPLPAWRFRTGFGSLLAWPAVAPEAFWRMGSVAITTSRATTSDGVRLEVDLPAPPTPCSGEKPRPSETSVREEAGFVVVGVRAVDSWNTDCAHNSMYRSERHEVTLREPLGARLLVDEANGVIPVAKR